MQQKIDFSNNQKGYIKPTGKELRDIGIQKAINNADEKTPSWSAKAYSMLEQYLMEQNCKFMVEDFRTWATENGLEEPPSNRAFGAIIVRAKKNKLIKHAGFRSVKNPNAHATPASVWVKL